MSYLLGDAETKLLHLEKYRLKLTTRLHTHAKEDELVATFHCPVCQCFSFPQDIQRGKRSLADAGH